MGCVELWHGYRKSFAPSGLPWLLSARKGHGLGHGSGRDRTLQGRAPTQVRACVESCGWQVELCCPGPFRGTRLNGLWVGGQVLEEVPHALLNTVVVGRQKG